MAETGECSRCGKRGEAYKPCASCDGSGWRIGSLAETPGHVLNDCGPVQYLLPCICRAKAGGDG